MTTTSSLAKLGLHIKHRPIRIMVIGQSGVGKTAMIVRFITKRFIGEYDPNLEKIYTFNTIIDNEIILFEILDTAGQLNESYNLTLETNIKWADAFILMYSVTDLCSFDECNRLKFLINYNRKRKKMGSNSKDTSLDVPVILVGNKIDQFEDRMVKLEDGQRRFREISCTCFHEISVRESVDQVWAVFRDACRFWRVFTKFPKLKRSSSDHLHSNTDLIQTSDTFFTSNTVMGNYGHGDNVNVGDDSNNTSFACFIHDWHILQKNQHSQHHQQQQHQHQQQQQQQQQHQHQSNTDRDQICSLEQYYKHYQFYEKKTCDIPFRNRAATDGKLLSRPKRWRSPTQQSITTISSILSSSTPSTSSSSSSVSASKLERRMSISMRGNNASY